MENLVGVVATRLSLSYLSSVRLFDVSKQVAGQLFVHGINLLVSGLVSHHTDGNACVSYFLNILIDTTFGGSFLRIKWHSID